jgi:hypothetical protein
MPAGCGQGLWLLHSTLKPDKREIHWYSGKTGDPDHLSPDKIDHLKPELIP